MLKLLIQKLKRLVRLLKQQLALVQKKVIIIHHTATSRDYTKFKSINRGHRTRKFPISSLGYHCGYHYLITGNGSTYQARKEYEQSYGSTSYKHPKLEIVLTGNFETESPSQEQLDALETILKRHPGLKVKGHRDISKTLCPGQNLYNYIKGRKK